MKKILFSLIICSILLPNISLASQPIYVYLFSASAECPYCAQTEKFFETLKQKQFPEIVLYTYNLQENKDYVEKFKYFSAAYNQDIKILPVSFIGDQAIVGYDSKQLLATLNYCQKNTCEDAENYVINKLDKDPFNTPSAFSLFNNKYYIYGSLILISAIAVAYLVFKKNK